MNSFPSVIESWHDFYLMVGTAAATLVGLLFVSLSLNPEGITGEAKSEARMLAGQTFANFLSVLMFAVVFLIPDQGPMGLGLPLAGIGAFGLYQSLRRLKELRAVSASGGFKNRAARQVGIAVACYVALLVVAVSVLFGQTSGLYWLVPVMIILIAEASMNAWNLLVKPYRQKA
jgi:hypothetical protein